MKYNIQNAEVLGQGNFAKVYKMYDKERNIHIALRYVDKKNTQQQDIIKQKTINKQLMKVDSPYILKIFDIQQNQQQVLYVTEYCEGGSLWQCISQQPNNKINQIHSIQFILKIAKGLQILHNNKITHRDLKPENILLSKKYKKIEIPQIKIADFGLSTNKMIMETVAGTKQYIAPQQAKHQSYTNAVDIWALGIIFDQMLHGNTFYSGQSNSEIFKKITNEQYHVRDSKISIQIKQLLNLMLKKKPFQRPTIGQIILKLQNYILKIQHKTPKKQRQPQKANSTMKVNHQDKGHQKVIIKGQLDIIDMFKCKIHKKQLIFMKKEDEQFMCLDCINDKTIGIDEYLKNQENPYNKLYSIQDKYPDIDLVVEDINVQFEKTRKYFNDIRADYKYINSNLKKQYEIKQFLKLRQNQKNSLDQLKNYYDLQLKEIKSQFFKKINQKLLNYIDSNIK